MPIPLPPAGISLHSRYNPELEAERFVGSSLAGGRPSTILFLGAGLGYVVACLARHYPEARLLAVYHDPSVHAASFQRAPFCWHPGLDLPLDSWLRSHLLEMDLEGLRVLEWQPSTRAWPARARAAAESLEQVLRELRGSLVTTAGMGRRWLRNSFLNFSRIGSLLRPAGPRADERPILISASGPSLERARPLLQARRRELRLWALPSAVPFLRDAGLDPDLVVMTDPGYYALYHMHPLAGRPFSLAMPLSAAAGAWRFQAGVLLIGQHTFFESALLASVGLEVPFVPPQGTVAATALELALRLRPPAVILAGLDLCSVDLQSHARPNAFERFLQPSENRLSPLYALLFREAAERMPRRLAGTTPPCRSGLVLDTYAGWLAGFARRTAAGTSGQPRIFRLHPSPVALPGLPELDSRGLEALLPGGGSEGTVPRSDWTAFAGAPDCRQRRQAAVGLLDGWRARLLRGRDEVETQRSILPLLEDPFLPGFCYYCNAAAMVELKKIHRLEGAAGAAAPASRLLADSLAFLDGLAAELQEWGGLGR